MGFQAISTVPPMRSARHAPASTTAGLPVSISTVGTKPTGTCESSRLSGSICESTSKSLAKARALNALTGSSLHSLQVTPT